MCGHAQFPNGAPLQGADLGLFSITLNDDVIADREMLECYKAFRIDAERCGFRHFLEVFFRINLRIATVLPLNTPDDFLPTAWCDS